MKPPTSHRWLHFRPICTAPPRAPRNLSCDYAGAMLGRCCRNVGGKRSDSTGLWGLGGVTLVPLSPPLFPPLLAPPSSLLPPRNPVSRASTNAAGTRSPRVWPCRQTTRNTHDALSARKQMGSMYNHTFLQKSFEPQL